MEEPGQCRTQERKHTLSSNIPYTDQMLLEELSAGKSVRSGCLEGAGRGLLLSFINLAVPFDFFLNRMWGE